MSYSFFDIVMFCLEVYLAAGLIAANIFIASAVLFDGAEAIDESDDGNIIWVLLFIVVVVMWPKMLSNYFRAFSEPK